MLGILLLSFIASGGLLAKTVDVPLGGNGYLTTEASGRQEKLSAEGLQQWSNPETVCSVFFHVDRATALDLSLQASVPQGESRIRATVGGKTFEAVCSGTELQTVALGRITLETSGYVRVDLQGLQKSGPVYALVKSLVAVPQDTGAMLSLVDNNEKNRFYWDRRGPSVHLKYATPKNAQIEYTYSEITVPVGGDPSGSYYMANGFGEGYFGMQVNSATERRVLFSVWSPFHTDDPKEIPESDRIILLKKGDDVRTGSFGNEGSGGQSFLVFPWKTGSTYRFLNRAHPDGKGNTDYAAWFYAEEVGAWKLIASFKRPKTDKYLTGFHSFLENFNPKQGFLTRQASYRNPWVRTKGGQWHTVDGITFTGDDCARRGVRLDFAGGLDADGKGFFLKNGGFFHGGVPLNSTFKLPTPPSSDKHPQIDVNLLDR